MSEINAAFGLASLDCLDAYVEANRRNYDEYSHTLTNVPGIRFVPVGANPNANCQYVVLEVAPALRDPLITFLEGHNVFARRYFFPGCHRLGFSPDAHCPITDLVAAATVVLPTGTAVSPGMARQVADLVLEGLSMAPTG